MRLSDSLCHCLRPAIISARASSLHPFLSARASSVHLSDCLHHCLCSARASSLCTSHCESFVGASFSLPSSLPLFHNHRRVALFMYPSFPPHGCWRWSIERATYQIKAPIFISWRQYYNEISASSLNYTPFLSTSCGFEHRRLHLGLCAIAFLLDFVLLPTSSHDNQGAH